MSWTGFGNASRNDVKNGNCGSGCDSANAAACNICGEIGGFVCIVIKIPFLLLIEIMAALALVTRGTA